MGDTSKIVPPRSIYSAGDLAALYGLPAQTMRRALDRAVRRGLLAPLVRVGHRWRMVAAADLPAVRHALHALEYCDTF